MSEIQKNNIDLIDKKLLAALEQNARAPITLLAKSARVSRSVAEYRLKQFEKREIIKGYHCLLDPSKFGLTVWKLWITLQAKSAKEKREFFKHIDENPHVWWYAETAGIYDAVICVLARSPHEFHGFYTALQEKYLGMITNSTILINVSFEYHTRGHLLGKQGKLIGSSFQEKPLQHKISRNELDVLRCLSESSRMSYAELALRTKRDVKTLKKIIRDLEKSGVIVQYRPAIDANVIGYEFYKVLLYLHNPRGGILPSIVQWARVNKNIIAVISCVGPWQLELEVEIDSFRNLCDMLSVMKEEFPDVIKNYEVVLITREGKTSLDLVNTYSLD